MPQDREKLATRHGACFMSCQAPTIYRINVPWTMKVFCSNLEMLHRHNWGSFEIDFDKCWGSRECKMLGCKAACNLNQFLENMITTPDLKWVEHLVITVSTFWSMHIGRLSFVVIFYAFSRTLLFRKLWFMCRLGEDLLVWAVGHNTVTQHTRLKEQTLSLSLIATSSFAVNHFHFFRSFNYSRFLDARNESTATVFCVLVSYGSVEGQGFLQH